MESRKQYKFTCVLFGVYFVALIWIILFKTQFSFEKLRGSGEINLIPFAGSAIVNGKIEIKEIVENILVFVPFGIYMPMLKLKWSVWKKILPFFLTSLIVEVLQYVLAIGAADITDLIGNTLGGVIGIGIFYIFYKIFGKRTVKIINILACVSTVAVVTLMGVIIVVNM